MQDAFGLAEDDVKSTGMGQSGEDVQLSSAARERIPWSVECKNVEKVNLWASWKQCVANSGEYKPVLVIKRNYEDPIAVVKFIDYMELIKDEGL